MRSAMLAGLTAETLAAALEAWKRGDLRQLFQFWEDMAERDDVIPGVKSKREEGLARREWQIVTASDLPAAAAAEAERQKAVLNEFWDGIAAVNAYDQNERGGFAKLVEQMQTAVSFKYAAHHLAWRLPARGRPLSAVFEFVPLTFFENQSGLLRFCENGIEYTGQDIALVGDDPRQLGDWIVTTGKGLMVPGGICYFAKRNALADWLIFSERMAMKGVIGRTRASAESDAGLAMAQAVEDVHSDLKAVIYGDDGESKIETLDVSSASGTLPMPALVERMDRRLAALYMGADLSTFSSTQGQGSGASLQAEQAVMLEQGDAQRVQDVLDTVSRAVLRYTFGPNVKPYAWLKIVVPTATDQKLLLTAVETLVAHGAKLSVSDVMSRLGFSTPKEGDEVLTPKIDYNSAYAQEAADGLAPSRTGLDAHNQRQQNGTIAALNASGDEADFVAECSRLLVKAAQRDRAPIASALREVLAADDSGILERLSAFNAALPSQVLLDAEQVKAWHSIIASAALRGWTLGTPEGE